MSFNISTDGSAANIREHTIGLSSAIMRTASMKSKALHLQKTSNAMCDATRAMPPKLAPSGAITWGVNTRRAGSPGMTICCDTYVNSTSIRRMAIRYFKSLHSEMSPLTNSQAFAEPYESPETRVARQTQTQATRMLIELAGRSNS
jgi:hypothetical protein